MLHIKNGRVIDPARGIDEVRDLFIRNSKIVQYTQNETLTNEEIDEVDASGCLVLPGLIDFHAHVAHHHTDFGIAPDAMTFPNGVTSVVDPGSTGTSNFEGFYKHVVCAADTTIKCFVNVTAMGVSTYRYVENLNPDFYDIPRLNYIFERYKDVILGLKLRMGKDFTGALGTAPLARTKEIAANLKTPMYVHVVYPEISYDDILAFFGEGDVLCHCFQSKGPYSILGANGGVLPSVHKARERGVLFDAAFGKTLHNYKIIKAALADGFMPDIISTDMTCNSIYHCREPHSLLYVIAAFMAAGMPFTDVLKSVTAKAARLMGMEGQIGTLAAGALADVSIFKMREKEMRFADEFGNSVTGTQLLVPQMTIKAGRIVFRQIDFTI